MCSNDFSLRSRGQSYGCGDRQGSKYADPSLELQFP